jgi:hypothetical protein
VREKGGRGEIVHGGGYGGGKVGIGDLGRCMKCLEAWHKEGSSDSPTEGQVLRHRLLPV